MTLEQDLSAAAEALISGRTDRLEQCIASLESAALVLKASATPERTLPLEGARVRALLRNAGEFYAGLLGALSVQCAGYDAAGNVRSLPSATGTRLEFRG